MKTRKEANSYMQERRERLVREGTCVDCQRNKVTHDEHCPRACQRRHICCSVCREARRARLAANRLQISLPLPEMAGVASQRLSTERGKSRFPARP